MPLFSNIRQKQFNKN